MLSGACPAHGWHYSGNITPYLTDEGSGWLPEPGGSSCRVFKQFTDSEPVL